MSFKAQYWASKQTTRQSVDKFTLVMLASYASNEEGDCFPSLNTLAKITQMSKRTIQRCLKRLEEDGFIEIRQNKKDGVYLQNTYHLCLSGVWSESQDDLEDGMDCGSDGMDSQSKGIDSETRGVETQWPRNKSGITSHRISHRTSTPSSPPRGDERDPDLDAEQEQESLLLTEGSAASEAIEQRMVAIWHEETKGQLPKVVAITDQRKRALLARYKDTCGKDLYRWRGLCRRIMRSDFLSGRSRNDDRPWRCTIDWVVKPSNITKILEGHYDNKEADRYESLTDGVL